jgi:hypothetical protein
MSPTAARTEYMMVHFDLLERFTVKTRSGGDAVRVVPEFMSSSDTVRDLWQETQGSTQQFLYDAWQSEFDAFRASVTQTPLATSKDSSGQSADATMARVQFPDGDMWDGPASIAGSVIMRKFAVEHGDRPTKPGSESYEDWVKREEPVVEQTPLWRRSFILPDGAFLAYPSGDTNSIVFQDSLPQVVKVLNDMGADGWSVVESHHDKFVTKWMEDFDSALPIRSRYLLSRVIAD